MPLTATMKRTSTLTTYCAYFLVVSSFASAMGIELEKRDDGSSQKRLDIPVQYGSSGQYAMAVNMATGPNIQDFNFTFTLGSGLTYAAGTSCQTCTGIGLYNQTDSTTARSLSAPGNGSFITGSVSGPLIKETCSMTASNGTLWAYTNQTVVVVNDQQASVGVPSDLLGSNSGVSGIVGFGTNRIPVSSSSLGLQDSIYGQFFNRNPSASNFTFGMQLNKPILTPRNTSSSSIAQITIPTTSAGTLNWLQPDPNAYMADQLTYKTTIDPSTINSGTATVGDWSISLDGWVFAAGSTHLSNARSVVASLETMYEDIYFPLDQATLLHAAIPGATLSSTLSSLGAASQAWIIPCNSQFTFGFVVGSQTFTLNTESLVIQLGDGTCVSAIESWTDASNNHYLLGARFISSVYLIFTISKDGTQTVGFAPPVTSTSTSKSNVGAIVGGTIGGVALLLIAAGVGIFFWKRHRNQSALRATQGQFDPDLTAGDKPEGPSAIPYTIGAPSAVRNGESVQNSAASPNTQSSFRQSQIAPSPGPSDPLLLTADHPDVLPPAYEASDLQLSGGGSNTSHDRPRDVKSHLRNPSTGSAAPP